MRSPAVLLLFTALAASAGADTVYLVNGSKFEEVVAERRPGEVRIRMAQGEIVLPDRVVARVERSQSLWQAYGERELALASSTASAGQWLDLARWADEAGYADGMLRSALRAAVLDPSLPGLTPLMAKSGYMLDDGAGEWLPEAEYMHRRGFRRWGDHWLPEEEHALRRRAQEEARNRQREEARQERITRAIEALVVAELSRAAEPEPEPIRIETPGRVMAVYPGGYFSFPVPTGVAVGGSGPDQATFESMVKRQPGSLFPIRRGRNLPPTE